MKKLQLCMAAGLVAITVVGCSRKAPAIKGVYPLVEIAKSVYVLRGPNELPNRQNQGFEGNSGFIVAPRGVIVVDPGSSVQVGELLLGKIRSVTSEPVIGIFDTSVRGDHWLGNQAIRAAYPRVVIYADAHMMAKAPAEGKRWIARLNRLTDGAVKGTQIVTPDLAVEAGDTLALGGWHFVVFHPALAATDNDIMLEVREAKAIFLGDVVLAQRAADPDEGSLQGNMSAIDSALKSDAVYFVPGHGDPGGREVALTYRAYLAALSNSVARCRQSGMDEQAMRPVVYKDLQPYHAWVTFNEGLAGLIHRASLENSNSS